jgi:hypothetical protein
VEEVFTATRFADSATCTVELLLGCVVVKNVTHVAVELTKSLLAVLAAIGNLLLGEAEFAA